MVEEDKLHHRRLVSRDSLRDLEIQVRQLQSAIPRWDIDRSSESITLVQALDDLADNKRVVIAMVRELTDEEYANVNAFTVTRPGGVQAGGTG